MCQTCRISVALIAALVDLWSMKSAITRFVNKALKIIDQFTPGQEMHLLFTLMKGPKHVAHSNPLYSSLHSARSSGGSRSSKPGQLSSPPGHRIRSILICGARWPSSWRVARSSASAGSAIPYPGLTMYLERAVRLRSQHRRQSGRKRIKASMHRYGSFICWSTGS